MQITKADGLYLCQDPQWREQTTRDWKAIGGQWQDHMELFAAVAA